MHTRHTAQPFFLSFEMFFHKIKVMRLGMLDQNEKRTWLIYGTHKNYSLSRCYVCCVQCPLLPLFLCPNILLQRSSLTHYWFPSLPFSLLLYPHSTTKHLTNDSLLTKWRHKQQRPSTQLKYLLLRHLDFLH